VNVPGSDETPQVARKLHHLPPREVAEELTLMDAELLRRIQPSELEDGAWMDKTSKVSRCCETMWIYSNLCFELTTNLEDCASCQDAESSSLICSAY